MSVAARAGSTPATGSATEPVLPPAGNTQQRVHADQSQVMPSPSTGAQPTRDEGEGHTAAPLQALASSFLSSVTLSSEPRADLSASHLPSPVFDNFPENAKWIQEQYNVLASQGVPSTYQFLWKKLLSDWVSLERALGFGYMSSGFPAAGRSVEIGDWIQRARKGVVTPHKMQAMHETFKTRWTPWWSSCNPPWRPRDKDGHPAIGGGQSEDWTSMFIPSEKSM
ncbi:hypothetical protein PsYK624_163090 [Phanerochaete sordida]|uniref:Uncharacterized protein n=1 Tax=Phanerochaete sordida TaxID=48140 RepID=A0A9P3LLZ3_9APHY|nr:hypothetical protein PsYK624_163090 [Phanerochaete sordida]